MYLTKLTINPHSRAFRRDTANIHDMHRTIMSAYPDSPDRATYRHTNGVLWRIDPTHDAFLQYIQSHTQPTWDQLPEGHLLKPAEVRPLQPVLDSITAGRRYAFRLLANPTRCIRTDDNPEHRKRVPHRLPAKQIEWLINKGEQHGFVIPTSRTGGPDVAPAPAPTLRGKKQNHNITIEPVRFDGHLVVTNPRTFTHAILNGIGRAKSYGCGLLTLAPTQTHITHPHPTAPPSQTECETLLHSANLHVKKCRPRASGDGPGEDQQ
ncbi:type I-E CRISPR-associated protein Cas6/Cse3/CasE [Actinocrispum wychmicini]|uniref:type I-E CRISPR-associated protein Cas6/Cse3/CasE n=1 Tax=Actinocrispum wychmicini TaxID=1213861 RepID=UPI003C79911C